MAELIAIDVYADDLSLIHVVLCEKHYGEWAMEPDSWWDMCSHNYPPQDFCDKCEMETAFPDDSRT